jgi:Na+-transporting methylmalonyl-CoA/oxaloacetate decarboxylase gamma subunit
MNATTLSIPGALGTSVLGFAIVFFVLIVLMYVIKIIRGALEMTAAPAAAAPAGAVAAPAAAKAASNMVPAKGSLGDIRLFDVEDRTAAMIMAIVADKMDAPLNELRFLSIREKK